MSDKHLTDRLYSWRVRFGFFGIILSIILSEPNFFSMLGGVIITAAGLILRAWACGHLRKEKELTTTGPYSYTRNPLYLGNMIIGIGVVVGSRSLWILCYFILYFLIFYSIAVRKEKEKMKKLYPDQYNEFSQKVSLFFPSFKSAYPYKKNSFNWDFYKTNREQRALIGAILFWLLMLAKNLFL
jgi:protein-S-isoprenylcysteine O-methyltransferase Ste14